jgi:hypothetical protein
MARKQGKNFTSLSIQCKHCHTNTTMRVRWEVVVYVIVQTPDDIWVHANLICPNCDEADDYIIPVTVSANFGRFEILQLQQFNPLNILDYEIRQYIGECTYKFRNALKLIPDLLHGTKFEQDPDFQNVVPVIKYMHPQHLDRFINRGRFYISRSEGFTWGDGVYVAPITSIVSSMMYGRCGGIGWLKGVDRLRVFDATQPQGIDLYQRWIQRKKHNYDLLTTTVHAPNANRALRNDFKQQYGIELVQFRPDETHHKFSKLDDLWYAVSDWRNWHYSNRIDKCKWVLFGAEEFHRNGQVFVSFFDSIRNNFSGPSLIKKYRIFTGVDSSTKFIQECLSAYIDDEIVVVMP